MDIVQQLDIVEKEEKRLRAKVENLVNGANVTNELGAGRHYIEKLADIPIFFKISKLKERKPPGKITIESLEPKGTSINIWWCFSNKRPGHKNFMGSHSVYRTPYVIKIRTGWLGRTEQFNDDDIYITVESDCDTNVKLLVSFKLDR